MRKGITAVVAIVLLLMMTVGAAGLAYVWVTNLQNKVQDTTGSNVKQISDEQGARISIDAVWNASNYLNFTIRNTGTYTFDATNFGIYVGNEKVTPGGLLPTSFAPKSVITLNSTKLYPSGIGNSQTVKVTTEIGSAQATYVCQISSTNQAYC